MAVIITEINLRLCHLGYSLVHLLTSNFVNQTNSAINPNLLPYWILHAELALLLSLASSLLLLCFLEHVAECALVLFIESEEIIMYCVSLVLFNYVSLFCLFVCCVPAGGRVLCVYLCCTGGWLCALSSWGRSWCRWCGLKSSETPGGCRWETRSGFSETETPDARPRRQKRVSVMGGNSQRKRDLAMKWFKRGRIDVSEKEKKIMIDF